MESDLVGVIVGAHFSFVRKLVETFHIFAAWPQRENRVGIKQGELTKFQVLKDKFFH